MKHPFQEWLDKNGAVDVRFYPRNRTESTAKQILDDAFKAVQAMERGESVEYIDNSVEEEYATR